MLNFDLKKYAFNGFAGSLPINKNDLISKKIAMLLEGECQGLGPKCAAEKYGYTKQRYFQIRADFIKDGALVLKNKKTGPKTKYRMTDEIIRQVIRHKFLDNDVSPDVITQKLQQRGFKISKRSVERIIQEYGLQKKNYILVDP